MPLQRSHYQTIASVFKVDRSYARLTLPVTARSAPKLSSDFLFVGTFGALNPDSLDVPPVPDGPVAPCVCDSSAATSSEAACKAESLCSTSVSITAIRRAISPLSIFFANRSCPTCRRSLTPSSHTSLVRRSSSATLSFSALNLASAAATCCARSAALSAASSSATTSASSGIILLPHANHSRCLNLSNTSTTSSSIPTICWRPAGASHASRYSSNSSYVVSGFHRD